MASGRLGAASLAADTDTGVYTVPAAVVMTVNVLFCNRGADAATVRLALVDGAVGALADEDYIEHGTVIPAGGVLERSGLALSAGETVVVRSDKATVSVRVHGYEEA